MISTDFIDGTQCWCSEFNSFYGDEQGRYPENVICWSCGKVIPLKSSAEQNGTVLGMPGVDVIEARAAEITGADPDIDHCKEDNLYILVLRLIAAGHGYPKELAAAALKTQQLDFPRWTA